MAARKKSKAKKPRKTSRRDWRPRFLRVLAETANISDSCRRTRVSSRAVYDNRDRDPEFAAKMADAIDKAVDLLELEARRRAMIGTEKPVYQGGELVGYVREYSDVLMIFLLKAHRPEKYRDNFRIEQRTEISGPAGGPVEIDYDALSVEVLRELAASLEKSREPKRITAEVGGNGDGDPAPQG